MEATQVTIGFNIAVVTVWCVADHFIGPHQTTKPIGVHTTRRHPVCFVNDETGQPTMLLMQLAQFIEHFLITEPAATLPDNSLRGVKILRRNDRFKDPVRAHPHIGCIFDMALLQLEGGAIKSPGKFHALRICSTFMLKAWATESGMPASTAFLSAGGGPSINATRRASSRFILSNMAIKVLTLACS